MGIVKRFLGVFVHPNRDEEWYRTHAIRLPASDRAEQYPRTPEEGFIGTGGCWFDLDKLNLYQQRWRDEGRSWLYRMNLVETHKKAAIVKRKDGDWRVYREPEEDGSYAIAGDVASGSGDDFSSAHVIDLSDGAWVAEYHARVGEDIFAKDLYYAGKWYNNALIAVETQGGYGRAVIIPLRDGVKGRKPYYKLYRQSVSPAETVDPKDRDQFGFPMNQANRPLVINQLEQWIRDELCPWITPDLDSELRTFAKRKTRPSPRALEGCNDDRVMSAAISLELYRQFGTPPQEAVDALQPLALEEYAVSLGAEGGRLMAMDMMTGGAPPSGGGGGAPDLATALGMGGAPAGGPTDAATGGGGDPEVVALDAILAAIDAYIQIPSVDENEKLQAEKMSTIAQQLKAANQKMSDQISGANPALRKALSS
jgi:hypothetical protein